MTGPPDPGSADPGRRPDPAPEPRPGPRSRRLTRLRRRASGALVLGIALGTVGVGYAAFAPSSTASEPSADASPSDVAHGEQLYRNACIACHAANLQGVQGRGPSLLGVGQAAVYFQVATGRMPASGQ